MNGAVTVEDRDGVTVICLQQGPVNALDLEVLTGFTEAFAGLDADRPVVVTGRGRAFSAGVDLTRIVSGGTEYVQAFMPALTAAFLAPFEHPAPVVAAVNGHAVAGGCVLVASCDRRLMSGGGIGLVEFEVGVPFPTAALEIMRYVVGPRLQRLVLSRELLEPASAETVGLIDLVVEPHELLTRAVAEARWLASLPRGVFALTKRQMHRPTRNAILAHAQDDAAVMAAWTSREVHDRMQASLVARAGRRDTTKSSKT